MLCGTDKVNISKNVRKKSRFTSFNGRYLEYQATPLANLDENQL